ARHVAKEETPSLPVSTGGRGCPLGPGGPASATTTPATGPLAADVDYLANDQPAGGHRRLCALELQRQRKQDQMKSSAETHRFLLMSVSRDLTRLERPQTG
ncbi:MAG: hypothetical protein M3541_23460, partial [Acidobacteriota bacterium]|nr:hypothetical protein [Acidobacteriota bacterium]